MPARFAAVSEHMWTRQPRHLQYQRVMLRRPEEVGTSLPYGATWSMKAMVAVLHLPITAIVARCMDRNSLASLTIGRGSPALFRSCRQGLKCG